MLYFGDAEVVFLALWYGFFLTADDIGVVGVLLCFGIERKFCGLSVGRDKAKSGKFC